MKKDSSLSVLLKGIIKENPVFVLVLGTCPTIATTTNLLGAFSMGIAALAVLICSNVIISLLRRVIPESVRSISQRLLSDPAVLPVIHSSPTEPSHFQVGNPPFTGTAKYPISPDAVRIRISSTPSLL